MHTRIDIVAHKLILVADYRWYPELENSFTGAGARSDQLLGVGTNIAHHLILYDGAVRHSLWSTTGNSLLGPAAEAADERSGGSIWCLDGFDLDGAKEVRQFWELLFGVIIWCVSSACWALILPPSTARIAGGVSGRSIRR